VRLLYGITTELMATLCDRFCQSRYRLYFTDHINASPNPDSANPLSLLKDFEAIVQQDDRANPKFFMHKAGVRQFTEQRLAGKADYDSAVRLIDGATTQDVKPYLAVLEVDTYEANHSTRVVPLPPDSATSIRSIEYLLDECVGPNQPGAELHLEPMFF